MGFEKHMRSEAPFIVGNATADADLFQPGFSYELGGVVRIVTADVSADPNAPLRRVSLSDGATEIISVDSIRKDVKSHDARILPVDKRYVKTVVKEASDEPVKKKKKKKRKKKETKK